MRVTHETKWRLPAVCLIAGLGLLASSDAVQSATDCHIGQLSLTADEQNRLVAGDRNLMSQVGTVLTGNHSTEPLAVVVTVHDKPAGLEYNDLLFRVSMATVRLVDLPPDRQDFIPVEEAYSEAVAAGDVLISSERC